MLPQDQVLRRIALPTCALDGAVTHVKLILEDTTETPWRDHQIMILIELLHNLADAGHWQILLVVLVNLDSDLLFEVQPAPVNGSKLSKETGLPLGFGGEDRGVRLTDPELLRHLLHRVMLIEYLVDDLNLVFGCQLRPPAPALPCIWVSWLNVLRWMNHIRLNSGSSTSTLELLREFRC